MVGAPAMLDMCSPSCVSNSGGQRAPTFKLTRFIQKSSGESTVLPSSTRLSLSPRSRAVYSTALNP